MTHASPTHSTPATPSTPAAAGAAGLVSPRQPPPRPPAIPQQRRALVGLVVAVLLGAVFGFAGIHFGRQLAGLGKLGGAERLLFLAWLPLTWLLAVAWHECGHLLGGRWVGGRYLLLVVGPFKWMRTPGGVRFAWNRSVNAAGGLAGCLPTDDRDLRRRMAVMVAGGPVASVVLAGVMAAVAALMGPDGWTLGRPMAWSLAGMSALIAVVTLIPTSMGGLKSDGLRIYTLLRPGPDAEREAALLSLTIAAIGGVRPADYDEAKLAAATTPDDGSVHVLYGHLSAFHRHADRREWVAAQARLDRVLSGEAELPPFMRDLARADYAWLLGVSALAGTGDPGPLAVAARAWLESAGAVAFDPATRHRAEAAVLLAEGRHAEAAAAARAGLVAVETRSMAPVRNIFAADTLAELLRRAEG